MMRILPISIFLLLASCTALREQRTDANIAELPFRTDEVSELEIGSVDDESTDDDLEDVLLILDELTSNPIMVNTAQFDELMQIPAMRPAYARAIIRQRDLVGRFSNRAQLQSIPGIPTSVMPRIFPYLMLGSVADIIRDTILEPAYWTAGLKFESLTRVRTTIEKPIGYLETIPNKERTYPGPPIERYQRLTLRSRRLSVGTHIKAAPGTKGIDTQNVIRVSHLGLLQVPHVNNVILGKYKVSYGLGLSMSGGRAHRRGFDMTMPRSARGVVSPYTGSSYNLGHSGIALSRGNQIRAVLWASDRSYSGTSGDSLGVRWSDSEPAFRTAEEVARRDNFSVKLIGVRGSIHKKRYQIGLAGWSATTSIPIKPIPTLFGDMGLKGSRFGILSSDFEVKFKSGTIVAEVASDHESGKAVVIAGEASLADALEVSASARYFGPSFQSPYGASFSNWSGRPINEKGWLISLNYSPNRQSSLIFFSDIFSSPLPRSNNFMPTSGSELGVKLVQNFGITELQASVRQRTRDEETDATDALGRGYRKQYAASRTNAKIDIITSLLPRATWVTRAEWVRATEDISAADHGYLIHQNLSWWISSKTRLQARVTIFYSDSNESRLYAWEPDVGLASAMPSYQGEGSRHFMLVTFKPNQLVEIRVKVARTQMPYQYQIGSGNDLIQDNKRTQINSSLLIRI